MVWGAYTGHKTFLLLSFMILLQLPVDLHDFGFNRLQVMVKFIAVPVFGLAAFFFSIPFIYGNASFDLDFGTLFINGNAQADGSLAVFK